MVPVFCLDDGCSAAATPRARGRSSCSSAWPTSTRALRDRGSRLFVRHGRPERELPALAEELGAGGDPPQRRRRPVRAPPTARGDSALGGRRGVRCASRACSPSTSSTRSAPGGRSLHRVHAVLPHLAAQPRREVLGAPRALPALPATRRRGRAAALGDLGLEQEVRGPGARGRAAGARARCAGSWPTPSGATTRAATRSPATRCRRLSPYLHFGCVSPREIEQRLPPGEGAGGLPPPAVLARLLRPRARATSRPTPARSSSSATGERSAGAAPSGAFEAWCEGRTGYPVVDAGHAPAAARGLDAQPRPAAGRVVSDQGPRASTGAGASAGSCAC